MTTDTLTFSDTTVLQDGTRLVDLFDFDRRRISARVFSDPEIFELEMSRIFGRSWLFMGFESEIPEPGDYMVRPMGGDSVIVTRGRDGEVYILLNRCTHRGTLLCASDLGNVSRFRCPYHGWMFGPEGNLEAMPYQRDWLGPNGDRADYAMRQARVAIRGGLVFGTWDEELPDFETYLGDFKFYFDMLFCSLDKNFVSVGSPSRWSVPINWKIGAENFAGDAYHLQTAHASVQDIGMIPDIAAASLTGACLAEPRWAHSSFASLVPPDQVLPLETMMDWLPPETIPQLEHHLSPDQLTMLRRGSFAGVGNLFPNCSWIVGTSAFFFLRTWQPVGPNEIELRSWAVAHPDAPEEKRRAAVQGFNISFGVTGTFEQDDLAIWTRLQRSHQSVMGRREMVSYACTHGESSTEEYFPGRGEWGGPCHVWQGFPTDDHLWNFHMRWLHLMTGGEL